MSCGKALPEEKPPRMILEVTAGGQVLCEDCLRALPRVAGIFVTYEAITTSWKEIEKHRSEFSCGDVHPGLLKQIPTKTLEQRITAMAAENKPINRKLLKAAGLKW